VRTLTRIAVLAVAPAFLAAGSEAERKEIHPCPDGHGGTVYQDEECIDAPARPAAPAPAKAQAPQPKHANPPPAAVHADRSVRPSPPPAPARPAARAAAPAGADAFAPEVVRAWQRFLDALHAGDRAAARACLTGAAADAFGAQVETLPESGLRDLASAWSRFRAEGRAGPVWSIRILRPDERPKWIFLEKTAPGEWKISGI